MQCLFYSYILNKPIPCTLLANTILTVNTSKYVQVLFDPTQYSTYGLTDNLVTRYCSDQIRLLDIYPARNSQEIAYATSVMPNLVSDNHIADDTARILSIIQMLGSPISANVFYQLADFLSYEMLLYYCQPSDRNFLLTICTYDMQADSIPIPSPIPIPHILQMISTIFAAYPDNTVTYYIQDYKYFAEFATLTYPIPLNIPVLKTNLVYLGM